MNSVWSIILSFLLLTLVSFRAAAQCTPPGGVPVVACGTGTALSENTTLSSGTFNASGGSFGGVTLSGATLVLCGSVTLSNFTINSGNLVINSGASVSFTGNYNVNGGAFYNLGTVTWNTSVGLQGTNVLAYNDAGGTMTVTGTLAVFNTGTFYNNGSANAQTVILNSGAAVCAGPGSIANVVDFTNNQTNSVTVPSGQSCLHYTGTFTANNPVKSSGAQLIICQDPGASAPTGNIGSATLVTNCSSCQTALPVTLTSFTGARTGTQVRLQWTTSLEDNLRSFAVQQSTDGRQFVTIDSVAAHGQPSAYQFSTPITANSWFRLQMIDRDAKFTWSPVVFIEDPVAVAGLTILSNPVRGSIMALSIVWITPGTGEISVLDNVGRRLKRFSLNLKTGKNDLQLDLGGLAAGYYYLHFSNSTGQTKTLPFIKL